jgi:hypothetical protein
MGTSLVGKGLGSTIDGHDIVVRTHVRKTYKNRYSPEDYGVRADHIISTPRQINRLWEGVKFDFKEVWLYFPDNEDLFVKEFMQTINLQRKMFVDITPRIQPAIDWYAKEHNAQDTVAWPTKGTAAILAAIRKLRPERLQLAGFDWLVDSQTAMSRKSDRKGHDILCERALLEYISKRRNVEIIWSL